MTNPMRNAFFILGLARRELRGSVGRFGVFIACLALGVAAVAAVGLMSSWLRAGLDRDARVLLGGDLEVRLAHRTMPPKALEYLKTLGKVSHTVRLRSMARLAGNASASSLVEIKGVDRAYPLFGRLELEQGGSLRDALAGPDGLPGAAVEPRLLQRLGVQVGDVVLVGESRFRVAAVIADEPDRVASFFGLGPRMLMDMEDLRATGLLRPGAVAFHYYKLALPPGADPAEVKADLDERFPGVGWRLRDFSQGNRGTERFLGNMAMHLTLVGLASLLVGGVGAAQAVRSFVLSKTESIAVMKCLGASRRTIVAVCLAQTLFLAAIGCALGCALGSAGALGAASFLAAAMGLPVAYSLDPEPLLVAVGYGMLVGLAFSLWPLSAAGAVSPARLFRGYADPSSPRPGWRAALAVAATVLALLALTLAYAEHKAVALGFAGCALGAVLLFGGFAWLLRTAAARTPRPRDPRLAHALANLHRPGGRTTAAIFSLGLGLTVLAAVSLADGNLRRLAAEHMPELAPAYFFLDVPAERLEEFRTSLRSIEGVTRVEAQPSLRGRIVKIDGVPAEQVEVDPDVAWTLRSDRGLTYAREAPEDAQITAGRWWEPDEDDPADPRVCLDAEVARGFGVGLGDTITVNVLGREISPRIVCMREIDWTTLALNHVIVFAPGVLENAPHSFLATAYTVDEPAAAADAEAAIMRLIARSFPRVAAVYIKDVLADVSRILDAISLAVGATAGVTLLAGLLVLAETMRANLRERRYDAVIFKVLGATRLDVLVGLGAEFAALGAATAVLAGLLGALASWLFVTQAMNQEWVLLPGRLAAVCLGGVAATVLLGLLGVRRELGRKAWPILRNE